MHTEEPFTISVMSVERCLAQQTKSQAGLVDCLEVAISDIHSAVVNAADIAFKDCQVEFVLVLTWIICAHEYRCCLSPSLSSK